MRMTAGEDGEGKLPRNPLLEFLTNCSIFRGRINASPAFKNICCKISKEQPRALHIQGFGNTVLLETLVFKQSFEGGYFSCETVSASSTIFSIQVLLLLIWFPQLGALGKPTTNGEVGAASNFHCEKG